MRGSKFESFAKFIFECKNIISYGGLSVSNKCIIFVHKTSFYIMAKSQSLVINPELCAALSGLGTYPYVGIHVLIKNFMIKFRISPYQ